MSPTWSATAAIFSRPESTLLPTATPLFSAVSTFVRPESIRLPVLMAFFLYFSSACRPCWMDFVGSRLCGAAAGVRPAACGFALTARRRSS